MVDNQYRMKDEQFVNNLFPYLNGIFLSFFFFYNIPACVSIYGETIKYKIDMAIIKLLYQFRLLISVLCFIFPFHRFKGS